MSLKGQYAIILWGPGAKPTISTEGEVENLGGRLGL